MHEGARLSRGPDDTMAMAAALVPSLPPNAVLALHGELGSGKTCFVKGLARALDIDRPLTSPTFTIVQQYLGTRALIHADLYRIRDEDELLAIGFDELLIAPGIVAVEWAERAQGLLPEHTLHIDFQLGATPDERRLTLR